MPLRKVRGEVRQERGELAFTEEFEATGESAQIDGLLKFESKGGGGRFDSQGINPN